MSFVCRIVVAGSVGGCTLHLNAARFVVGAFRERVDYRCWVLASQQCWPRRYLRVATPEVTEDWRPRLEWSIGSRIDLQY